MDHETITKAIQSPPFFIGRITDVELRISYDIYHGTLVNIVRSQVELENNAGIHVKNPASLEKYVTQFVKAYDHCTHIAEWDKRGVMYQGGVGPCQEWIAKRTPTTPKINALSLEPYYGKDSWMPSLKGKRILIVHPFAATFQKQVSKLNLLFPNRSWFEDCTFQFVKPPMTMAGNHGNKDWQEHLNDFLPQIHLEFDVALVAAGGYGMLISDYIFTTLHKSVMYIGGALQIFFGVIGKRWFDNQAIVSLVNDDWVRPAQEERPPHYIKVEKGCYW
jgi:hypothetical protein